MLPGFPEHDVEAGRIAAAFAQRVETDFGRTPDELGIDPSIVAEWVISSLVYEESSTNAFPEAEDPHASVYFDIESCSMMTMYFEFQSNLYDYLRDQEFTFSTSSRARSSTMPRKRYRRHPAGSDGRDGVARVDDVREAHPPGWNLEGR